MRAGLCLLAVLFMAGAALADPGTADMPRGLGHPTDMNSHWYDRDCCSMTDCEPVTLGAISPGKDGYNIYFRSARGHVVNGVVPYGSRQVRPSQDKDEHVCSTPYRIYCIYIHFGV